jgi:hypothetical protein
MIVFISWTNDRASKFAGLIFLESGMGMMRGEFKSVSLSATLRLSPWRFCENAREAKDDEADGCDVGAGGL